MTILKIIKVRPCGEKDANYRSGNWNYRIEESGVVDLAFDLAARKYVYGLMLQLPNHSIDYEFSIEKENKRIVIDMKNMEEAI